MGYETKIYILKLERDTNPEKFKAIDVTKIKWNKKKANATSLYWSRGRTIVGLFKDIFKRSLQCTELFNRNKKAY